MEFAEAKAGQDEARQRIAAADDRIAAAKKGFAVAKAEEEAANKRIAIAKAKITRSRARMKAATEKVFQATMCEMNTGKSPRECAEEVGLPQLLREMQGKS